MDCRAGDAGAGLQVEPASGQEVQYWVCRHQEPRLHLLHGTHSIRNTCVGQSCLCSYGCAVFVWNAPDMYLLWCLLYACVILLWQCPHSMCLICTCCCACHALQNAMLQQFYMMPRFRYAVLSVTAPPLAPLPLGDLPRGPAVKGEITSALQVILSFGYLYT